MQKTFLIQNQDILRNICGVNDNNLKTIEKELEVSLYIKRGGILIEGNKKNIEKTVTLFERIENLAQNNIPLEKNDIKQFLSSLKNNQNLGSFPKERIKVPSRRKYIIAKTPGQKDYIKAMEDFDVTFSLGPAGTGKTYLAVAMAVNYLSASKVDRIILTRPAIEAGESLGYLPGNIEEKLNPYLKPLYDALYEMIDVKIIEKYLATGIIEIAPLAYMRGRTLNDAFIILDEAQNCTAEQLKMFLTRLGFDSKTVITGDLTQSDLPSGKPKGLLSTIEILKSLKDIKFIYLTPKDVVRYPLVQKIIQAYEHYGKK